ncbi:MAG: hypothetical protein ACFFFT_04935 [Candidatus Thorarchaeota archaeon]
MKIDIEKIDKILQTKIPLEKRSWVLTELPKAEALYKLAPKEVGDLIYKMYLMLNHQLGLICQNIDYPLKQYEWNDSKPLEIMGRFFKGIEASEWYQYNLGEIMFPSGSKLMQIII